MCIIIDIFAHHVFYVSFFFIILFSPTSIHHIVSHYHICLFSHSVAIKFMSLISSGPCVTAHLDSVLVLMFTASCVTVRSSCVMICLFWPSCHCSARFGSGLGVHSIMRYCSIILCIGSRSLLLFSLLYGFAA